MSIIDIAKNWLDEPSGDAESDLCDALEIIPDLIKELEQYRQVVEAAEWYQRTGYGDDPLAQPHLDKALNQLEAEK